MNLKTAIRNSIFFRPVAAWRDARAVRAWIRNGCVNPPPSIIKRHIINGFRTRHNITTFVETGTYLGDTVEFFRRKCVSIFSIELNESFARDGQRRFRAHRHIEILHGDSGVVLGKVLQRLNGPALFWLDGHYSGGQTAFADIATPIMAELDTIFSREVRNHIILIDDARLFNGTDGYPKLDALREHICTHRPNYSFAVENDIIRCIPCE